MKRLYELIRAFAQAQKGSMAVEAALSVVLFISMLSIVFDMHSLGMERARLEEGAGSIAQNIAVQSKLTEPGLSALVDAALQGDQYATEVLVLNVLQSGKISWMISRGDGAALCESPDDGGYFAGTLPEDPPEEAEGGDDEEDASTMSMVVVEVCRNSRSVKLAGRLLLPSVLEVESIYRAQSLTIELDEALKDENMIADNEESES